MNSQTDSTLKIVGFWTWFFRGSGERKKAGWKRLRSPWLLLDIAIGILIGFVFKGNLRETAVSMLVPLSGILVAMSFAVANSVHTLLDSDEIRLIGKVNKKDGYAMYPYIYQLSVLVLLVELVIWGMVGVGLFDCVRRSNSPILYRCLLSFLFGMVSFSIRACWYAITYSHVLLITKNNAIQLTSAKNAETSITELTSD